MRRYWDVFKNQKHPIKFLIAKILVRLKICKFLKINLKHYVLRFYPTSLSLALWIDSDYQHVANYFFADYLQTGDKVIDIGANVGTVTLECSTKVDVTGKVYSIEAHPIIFNYLCGNIHLNHLNNIKTYNVALGSNDDTVSFSNIRSDDLNSVVQNGDGIKVQLRCLDDLGINEPEIDLIKIDVLGYEKFVLAGADKILNKTKCVHFPAIERDFNKYGYSYTDVFEIFKKHGFQLFKLFDEKTISAIPYEHNSIDMKELSIDILAIRDLENFLNRTGFKLKK